MAAIAIAPPVGCRLSRVSTDCHDQHTKYKPSKLVLSETHQRSLHSHTKLISSGFDDLTSQSRNAYPRRQWNQGRSTVKASVSTAEVASVKFPAFLPRDVELLREPVARNMAARIQHLPVETSLASGPIMTSCVVPKATDSPTPIMLLHGFDSSLLEWRYTYPLLEEAGLETWAMDILGWGFSDADGVKSYNVAAKREHMYEFWKTYVKRPMVLVGPSLGGAAAIDFAVAHPEAVAKLVLVDAQGYTEGVGEMATMPKIIAYLGVALLKSVPLRLYANTLIFTKATYEFLLDSMRVGRLHCLMPGWADATVSFMLSGGYNVTDTISQVQQEALIIWGELDTIVPKTFAERFLEDLPKARVQYIESCGHIPHVEKPTSFVSILAEFCSQRN